ncbi:MAG: GDSL-type esterase/lipase family protein [Bacteroidales bacterium]|jgi:lysophospholipase L1-like esterase|nr:GDSL-type esterase/lipase family protein [Bacteroidales bacterium]
MKPYQITIVIFLVIIVFALIAAFFPENGIKVRSVQLRFPKLEQVMTRNKPAEIVDPMIAIQDSLARIKEMEKKTEEDTVNYYVQMIEMNPASFHLPHDDKTFFDSFFKMLENEQDEVVRILHYGDSQIEMDRMTSDIRKFFQHKFGGGGPGLIPLQQTVSSTSVYQSVSGELSDYAVYGTSSKSKDRFYGPLVRYYKINGKVHLTVSAPQHKQTDEKLLTYKKVTVLSKDLKGGLQAKLKPNKQTECELVNDSIGINYFTFALDTPTHRFTLTLHGNADIYGIMVDHQKGVAVDNIPIRGSSGTFFTGMEDSLLVKMYKDMRVGMIILQFGGNSVPGISGYQGIAYLKNTIASQIRFIRRCCPQAKILFIGPSDMSLRINGVLQTYPRLADLNEALKEAALENGAAYWDMFTIMGGEGSMIAWVSNGFAGNDYIHFTPKGAARIGEALVHSFSLLYEFYEVRKNLKHTN